MFESDDFLPNDFDWIGEFRKIYYQLTNLINRRISEITIWSGPNPAHQALKRRYTGGYEKVM